MPAFFRQRVDGDECLAYALPHKDLLKPCSFGHSYNEAADGPHSIRSWGWSCYAASRRAGKVWSVAREEYRRARA